MQEHKNILVKLLEYGSNESQAPSTYVGNWILSKKFDFYLKPKKADFINKSKIGLKRSTIVRKYYFHIEKYVFFTFWNQSETVCKQQRLLFTKKIRFQKLIIRDHDYQADFFQKRGVICHGCTQKSHPFSSSCFWQLFYYLQKLLEIKITFTVFFVYDLQKLSFWNLGTDVILVEKK